MTNSLKRPLTALLFAGKKFHDDVKAGVKRITIREGWRDYQEDKKVILCCHILDWAVMGKITFVRHCLLEEVSMEDLNADGMEDLTDAIISLQNFYPNINEKSPVTIIKWELV